LADKVQQNFDALGQQFPVSGANLKQVPQARVYNSANISVADATNVALTFDSERWDTGTSSEQHSTSANTSRLTCRVAGLYSIGGSIGFAANAVGDRFASLRLNGATYIGQAGGKASAVVQTAANVQTEYRLAVGDYVELLAYQNSGGALNALATGNYSPEFYWHWVSP
jgi:hypothetical protein